MKFCETRFTDDDRMSWDENCLRGSELRIEVVRAAAVGKGTLLADR